jgi:hypothetical protein
MLSHFYRGEIPKLEELTNMATHSKLTHMRAKIWTWICLASKPGLFHHYRDAYRWGWMFQICNLRKEEDCKFRGLLISDSWLKKKNPLASPMSSVVLLNYLWRPVRSALDSWPYVIIWHVKLVPTCIAFLLCRVLSQLQGHVSVDFLPSTLHLAQYPKIISHFLHECQ